MNEKIDRTTILYGLNKPRITSFILCSTSEKIEVCYEDDHKLEVVPVRTVICYPNVRMSINIKNLDPLETLEKYLNKARLVEKIRLNNFVIDQQWLNMLNRCKHYKTSSIILYYCNIEISIEKLAALLGKYKPSAICMDETRTYLEGTVNDKVFTNLLPTLYKLDCRSSLRTATPCPEITDKTLRAARNCMIPYFDLYNMKCSFTVEEVIKTAKMLIELAENDDSRFCSWHFGYVRIKSRVEMVATLAKMSIYPDVFTMDFDSSQSLISYYKKHYGFMINLIMDGS